MQGGGAMVDVEDQLAELQVGARKRRRGLVARGRVGAELHAGAGDCGCNWHCVGAELQVGVRAGVGR